MTPYLDTPAQWEAVARACSARGILGCDTETFGHNVKTSTPAFRAKIDVWSLALRTTELNPRGYHVSRPCVLPLAAALYPALRAVLESKTIAKVFHNAHHDQHAFANHGVRLGRVFDTLDAVRLYWPGRDGGYQLKPLRVALLGKEAREGFKELTEPQLEQCGVIKKRLGCSCGEPGCKKRKGHEKLFEEVPKLHKVPCPIESIVMGHARWQRKLDYAGADAEDALDLHELLLTKGLVLEAKLPELPW